MEFTNKDLIGNALLDFFNKESVHNLVVHSDIAEPDIMPVSHFFRPLEAFSSIEKRAVGLCKGKILDVGAGAGCHAVVLKNDGKTVFPIDVSAGAVKVMKARGLTNARQIDFFRMSSEKFDSILLLMNGIGICGTLDRLNVFLQNAKDLLNAGGQLIFDSSDIIYMFQDVNGSVKIDLTGDYYGEVTYRFEYRNVMGEPFKWLFLNYDLLEEIAGRNGFNSELAEQGKSFDYLARLTIK
jgi:SAM-dependent methyltransferase